MYIADRYVIQKLRGKKIGEKLLKIADDVARANDCELIFANLIAEDSENLEKLKKGHEKEGYKIVERDGKTIAIKKY